MSRGKAWQRRLGVVRLGEVRPGADRHGKAWQGGRGQVRCGVVRRCEEGPGKAGEALRGKARMGTDRRGPVRIGVTWQNQLYDMRYMQ